MCAVRRYALIVAGGTGTRLGAGIPKQMLPLAGKPILAHTVQRFLDFDPSLEAAIVLHPSLLPDFDAFCTAWFSAADRARVHACAGGSERTASVAAGLELLCQRCPDAATAWVGIHDAVRPFLSPALLQTAWDMALHQGNATVAVPVKSSMRRLLPGGGSEAVDRSLYYHVQTPQIFRLDEIHHCYAQRPHDQFTDDASLAEHFGIQIHLAAGDYANLKITTPEDLAQAEILLQRGF